MQRACNRSLVIGQDSNVYLVVRKKGILWNKDSVGFFVNFGKCTMCEEALDRDKAWGKFPCKCNSYIHKSCFDNLCRYVGTMNLTCKECGEMYNIN